MILRQITRYNGIIFYGYTYGTSVLYWSMRLYKDAEGLNEFKVNEIIHSHRFDVADFDRIVL